jgi:hypothetical protein
MSKIHKKDSSDDKNTNKTTETTKSTTTPANTTTNNYQRVSERVQQWNRSVIIIGFDRFFLLSYIIRNMNLEEKK